MCRFEIKWDRRRGVTDDMNEASAEDVVSDTSLRTAACVKFYRAAAVNAIPRRPGYCRRKPARCRETTRPSTTHSDAGFDESLHREACRHGRAHVS